MDHLSLFLIVNQVIILALNAKSNVYLIETAKKLYDNSNDTYAEGDVTEKIMELKGPEDNGIENVNISKFTIEANNSLEIMKKKEKTKSTRGSKVPSCSCSIWTSWSVCTKFCNGGERKRTRACTDNEGNECVMKKHEAEGCNTGKCVPTCSCSVWTPWSTCTKSCNGGERKRTRACTDNKGNECAMTKHKSEGCNTDKCASDEGWSDWGACSKTCGLAAGIKERKCTKKHRWACRGPSRQPCYTKNLFCDVLTPDAADVLSKHSEAYMKEIEKNNPGFKLVEGDMILNQNQQKTFGKNSSYVDYETNQALVGAQWPNNIVYYIFDKTVNKRFRNDIRRALAELRSKLFGCVAIVEGVGPNYAIVSAKRNRQCISMVGVNRYYKNTLNFDERRCNHKGIIQHEFIHTLGIFHQQARRDRDRYVKINWHNIIREPKDQRHNFLKRLAAKTYNLPYDYTSIMHYGGTFFSKRRYGQNKLLTIETRNPNYQSIIGRQDHISNGDIRQIKIYYGCEKDNKGLTLYVLISSGGAKYKYPELMGTYKVTKGIFNSFPVYKQKAGPGWAFVDSNGNWVVAKKNTIPEMYSGERPVLSSPPATKWFYSLNNNWKRDLSLSMISFN